MVTALLLWDYHWNLPRFFCMSSRQAPRRQVIARLPHWRMPLLSAVLGLVGSATPVEVLANTVFTVTLVSGMVK